MGGVMEIYRGVGRSHVARWGTPCKWGSGDRRAALHMQLFTPLHITSILYSSHEEIKEKRPSRQSFFCLKKHATWSQLKKGKSAAWNEQL
jgi:hypothetical protein